jgi:acetate---CoA ligase (ADP-forming) subunit beta
MDLLKTAIANKQTALSEFQSKRLLSVAGIPVTREKLIHSSAQAVSAAEGMGYPVVLKACSWQLMHKSEHGCIELNLTSARAVQQAYDRICEKTPFPLEGILVQEMVKGQRELMAGLSRDPQFGVCVMLGFGGILAEVIKDTVFRIAPFDQVEALDMVHQLKYSAMLAAFRGQAPADLEAVCKTLMALGQLGMDHETIAEIDINPLIVSSDGTVKAVDALIILEKKSPL